MHVYMHIFMCVGACVCPKLMLGIFLDCSLLYLLRRDLLLNPRAFPIWLFWLVSFYNVDPIFWLVSLFWGPHLLKTGITGNHHACLDFIWVVGIQCLVLTLPQQVKLSWSFSPAPAHLFLTPVRRVVNALLSATVICHHECSSLRSLKFTVEFKGQSWAGCHILSNRF